MTVAVPRGRVVCFGELLLRFTASAQERFMQSQRFDVHCGGAEANVAVSLARFGHDAAMVSAVADNGLGEACVERLRGQGVDVAGVQRRHGRMGLYFLEAGAVRRPSRIIYDRAGSVFARTEPVDYDWPTLLEGARWLHVSGITAAVGPGAAEAAIDATAAAVRLGVNVSFDGNYREALWRAWGGDGPGILKRLLSDARIAFINERDIALVLGRSQQARPDAVRRAFDAFPALEAIAATHRAQSSVTTQTLRGEFYTRESSWSSRTHALDGVVDRIGGGDAFAAGVLHALLSDYDRQRAVEFAAAASAIKHSIPGDWNLTTVGEVEAALTEQGLDVRR